MMSLPAMLPCPPPATVDLIENEVAHASRNHCGGGVQIQHHEFLATCRRVIRFGTMMTATWRAELSQGMSGKCVVHELHRAALELVFNSQVFFPYRLF